MKKLFLTVFIFCNLLAFGQIQDAWIYFNDKPMSQYYLDNPLQMLSQKALDRRISQNIALDFTDVPIHEPYISDISDRSEEHTSELQSRPHLVCRLLLEKKKKTK